MAGRRPQGTIVKMTRDRRDEAVAVLAWAFADYPLMHYFFAEQRPDQATYAAVLRAMFTVACERRLVNGWPLAGYAVAGELVGVAALNDPALPAPPDDPPTLQAAWARLHELAGPRAMERIEHFGQITRAAYPEQPHLYLGAIGVVPAARGQGYARLLLDEVHRRAARHPTATGVALDTETAPNVRLYEHMGYRQTRHAQLGPVDIWVLFRPNDRPNDHPHDRPHDQSG